MLFQYCSPKSCSATPSLCYFQVGSSLFLGTPTSYILLQLYYIELCYTKMTHFSTYFKKYPHNACIKPFRKWGTWLFHGPPVLTLNQPYHNRSILGCAIHEPIFWETLLNSLIHELLSTLQVCESTVRSCELHNSISFNEEVLPWDFPSKFL
mgnify:CR=1 FL=1